MDLEKIEFLPDDFEFVGDKQDITKDVVAPSLPAWKDSLNRFKKNKGAVIGLICILVIAVFAIFAPMFSSYKFDAINTRIASISPGAEHFFGTDTYGRDLFVRVWTGMSRITRAQVLRVKEEEFVLASRTLGASNMFIIFKEILPNIYSQMIIMIMMSIPNAIFYEAYLSFVGLGLPIPMASLGTLINDGFNSITIYPYMMVIPVIIFSILMLSFNLFGDGLRDALDPTMKEM